MKIVKSRDEAVSDDNYLVINGSQQAEVIINSYKTKKKYGDFHVKLSVVNTPEIKPCRGSDSQRLILFSEILYFLKPKIHLSKMVFF